MDNPYKGEIEVTVCGKTCRLKFDWTAITEILNTYGTKVFSEIVHATPETVARILAAGLRQEGITAEQIIKESPPLMPLMKAIDRAISAAYFGPKEQPPTEEGDASKKKPEA